MIALLLLASAGARTHHLGAVAPGAAEVVVTATESVAGGPPRVLEDRWVLAVGPDGGALRDDDGATRLPTEWAPGLGPDGARSAAALWDLLGGRWAGTDWKVGEERRALAPAAAPPLGWRVVPVETTTTLTALPGPRRAATTATFTLARTYAPDEVRASLEALRQGSPELTGTPAVIAAAIEDRWVVTLELAPVADGERALRPREAVLERVVWVALDGGGQAERRVTLRLDVRWAAEARATRGSRYTPGSRPVPGLGAPMENRRAFLRLSAVGLAAAASLPAVAHADEAPPADPVDWMFAPLAAGSDLGFGWMFARAFAPRDGAVTVNLVHRDGRAARVDLCRLHGAARGPARSGLCDFIVMDGADGGAPMDEQLGRVLGRLAAVVTENEAAHPDAVAALMGLEAHADRVWRHPEALAAAPRSLTPGAPE